LALDGRLDERRAEGARLSFVEETMAKSPTTMMRDAVELRLKRLVLDDESGQDLLEYALLVSLVALVAFSAVATVGTTINSVFWTYISGVMSGI
jgi:pilus assembly protein Flp/PilA